MYAGTWVLNLYGGSKEMIVRRTALSAASVDNELVSDYTEERSRNGVGATTEE
jgi:hypothetical protein